MLTDWAIERVGADNETVHVSIFQTGDDRDRDRDNRVIGNRLSSG
jgi:hypothetical protein